MKEENTLWTYKDFIGKINEIYDIDLSLYKEAQMKRRITSLRNKHGFDNFFYYFKAIQEEQDLLEEFLKRITINVSEFYRNPRRWDVLKGKVIPLLTKDKKSITIWSAACSTGEEPYSLAMLLTDYFSGVKFKILATDLDELILSKAKQGIYYENSLKEVPDFQKSKYFVQKNDEFHIDDHLKKNIVFKRHDLLKDPYPSNVDLIVCRNVLIYFTEEAKKMVYGKLSRALNNEGVLFIGSTEQIFEPIKYDLQILDTFFYHKKPIS